MGILYIWGLDIYTYDICTIYMKEILRNNLNLGKSYSQSEKSRKANEAQTNPAGRIPS